MKNSRYSEEQIIGFLKQADAGTGKVLSHRHESAKREAAEQAKDRAASKK